MAKTPIAFEAFFETVPPQDMPAVMHLHENLLKQGCTCEIKEAKSGYVASYAYGKRVLLNYVFRKKGLVMRIYADCVQQYADMLAGLPDAMKKAVTKAPNCRRMEDLSKCNQHCPMGYAFELDGEHLQKCRYNCFLLLMDEQSTPYLQDIVQRELDCRKAVA